MSRFKYPNAQVYEEGMRQRKIEEEEADVRRRLYRERAGDLLGHVYGMDELEQARLKAECQAIQEAVRRGRWWQFWR